MKNLSLFALFLLLAISSLAQTSSIKTRKIFQYQINSPLSDEYQYLSTELYLFQADQFTKLVNELKSNQRKNPWFLKKVVEDRIEYLMITANIKDIKYFGGDLIYPIYSFQASEPNKDGIKIFVDDNQEVIRIFDNLPLNPTRNAIDADIKGEIITQSTKDRILNIIADQLINISEVPSPTAASLAVIKEFGRFMKLSAGKNMYKFNSTIRLYEGQDFSRQFYSLDIYTFIPSHQKSEDLTSPTLQNYLSSNENPEINRTKLEELIQYSEYPWFVVVNYKSRYKSEEILTDDITSESISKLRVKIRKKFEDGTIPSQSAYIQEIKLLDYLEEFVEFKTQVNTYRLNEKNQITQDISKILFLVAEAYAKMQRSLSNREMEFKNDQTYQNSFREKYQDILGKADLMLELNQPLKNIRDLYTCINPQIKTLMAITPAEAEQQLRVLHQFVIPEDKTQKEISLTIQKKISEHESLVYQQNFEKLILQLKNQINLSEGIVIRDQLISQIKNSNCASCRSEVRTALEAFNQRYELQRRVEAEKKFRAVRKEAKDMLYYSSFRENCVSATLGELYPPGTITPKHIELLKAFTDELVIKRTILEQIITMPVEEVDYLGLEELEASIRVLLKDLSDGYAGLCPKLAELCNCNDMK